jgi:O-methyltransferase
MPNLDHILPSLLGNRETIYETYSLAENVKHLEGDIVECGVAYGAQIAAMKMAAPEKLVWAYDSYEGIQLAGKFDNAQPGINGSLDPNREIPEDLLVSSGISACSVREVIKNLDRWNLKPDGFRFVEGWVQNTLVIPENLPEKICVLRLDMDMHDPTLFALEVLFPRLVDGGVLIIDDWNYLGVQTALSTYFDSIGYKPDWKTPLFTGYLFK